MAKKVIDNNEEFDFSDIVETNNGGNEFDFSDIIEPVKKKETFGLGFEKPSEAMRMGGLPKQEKLSQSPLKTAANTTPSVSTKPKKNINYLTDINNLYKEKVSTSQERVNTKKELLNLQPQIENAYSQIEELNAIYGNVNLPIQERNEAAKSANLLLEQIQPIKSKYDELGLKYNDLVQKDKQAISKLKELDNQRQLQLQKEFSIGKDLFEKTGKGFVDAAAGVAGIFNTLGLSGDTEGGDDYDQEEVKQQTRQNIDKIRAFGNSLVTQETPQEWQSVFKGKFSPKKLAYITSQAVSSTVPTVAAGLFTGGAGTALAGAGMGFNESKDILKEAGLNDTQAEWASLGLSIPLGLLEEYGAGDVVKILSSPMVKKKVANELVKNIAGKQITKELLFNETKKSLGKVIADNAGSILTTGVKEAGTEVGQGTLQEIAKQAAQEYTGVNPDEQMPFEEYLKEFATQRGEEAVGGFLGGTALSGAGKALQVGLSGFKPNFTPSVYAQVKEFSDPEKLQEFQEDLQADIEQGLITPEQADEAMQNVQAISEADALIPSTIQDNDVRTTAVNLIIEKNKIAADIEGKDKSLVTPQTERIKQIDEQLVAISKGEAVEEQLTEEQDEQTGIEEPISTGTDVLETGVGVAVEPSKEGVTGEDIQTETVPQTPLEEQESDIERRRKEEYKKSVLGDFNYQAEKLGITLEEYLEDRIKNENRNIEISKKRGNLSSAKSAEKRKSELENDLINAKEINAKYDAELAALEKQQTPEVVSETVSEIEPPVVEQTTTDVEGVTSPDVSEALKDVESTAKALEGVSNENILSKIKTFSINGLKNFYHASQYKRKGRLRKSNAPQFGTGIYFSSNKDLVKNEFGENVTNTALNLSNPVFTNTPEWNKVTRRAIELADAEYGKSKNLKLLEDESYFKYDPDNLSEIDEIPSNFISDAAQELGYDAIIDEDSSTYENEIVVLDESKIIYDEDIPFFISEAYHKAKSDDSNPELVAAVEELLGQETSPIVQAKVEEVAPQQEPTPLKEEGEGDFEARQEKAKEEFKKLAEANNLNFRVAQNIINKYVRPFTDADYASATQEDVDMAIANREAGQVREGYEQKKQQEPKEDKAGETKQRAFAEFAAERGGIDPNTIPDGIRYYNTTSVEEQNKIAKDLVKKIGLDNAISLLTDGRYKPLVDVRNIPSLAAEVLNSIYELQSKTTDEAIIRSYANDVNSVLQETVIAAGNAATLMSMMREFYKSNPYNFVAQITTLIAKNNAPLVNDILSAINEINNITKNAATEAAGNVVNKVTTKKVEAAKAKYEKSKSNLKSVWNKGQKLGIAPNPYENAKNDIEFVKALTSMAKDFVVYQSVKFSEYLKEVASQLGVNESDIDKEHLKGIFDKAKAEKIASGIKLSLKELELKLKDLIEAHYNTNKSVEESLIEKLKTQFGLSDTDAKEVEDAIKHEIKVLTAKEKLKALNAKGIKNKKYIDEIITLSEVGLLDSAEILKSYGTKLGIQELTPEESAKLLAIAKEIQDSKEDRIKAKNIQKFEDYKFVLSKKYNISDFLVSNYLTNIFGSIGANLINVASNVGESILLTTELLTNALAKGSVKDIKLALKAFVDGSVRGFDFTKEVLKTGVASYKEPYQIHARNMWELIMDRQVDLNRTERILQMLFTTYVGKALLTERRFWNRALLSMDSLSGTTNMELGALWAATKEADKRGLKGDARANFIAEQMAATPQVQEEAIAYAIALGYKKGTRQFRRAVANYLVSKRPEEIKRAAYEYSGRATLTQEPPLNTITGQMANLLNTTIAKNQKLKFIFPVVNTFANLIIKNIERSPFEVFSLGLDAVISKSGGEYAKAGLTKEEVARRLKASAAATAVGVLIFMLAGGMDDDEDDFEVFGSGTGDPVLDNERRKLGWKPNTIRFSKGGNYYNFEYLPIGFLLSMVGNMRDYYKYKDEAAIAIRKAQAEKIFGKTLDSLTDEERNTLESELLSGKYNVSEVEQRELANLVWQVGKTPIQYPAQLFKSLGDLMGIIGDDKSPAQKGISFGANIVRGNVAPRYMGEVRDIFDNKLYDSKEFWNTAGANVPFIELGGVKLDGFGREIDKYESKSAWSGLKYTLTRRFYNPSRGTEVDQFLWENRIRVSPPNNSATMAYPKEAYKEYIVLRGKLAMEYIQEAINNGYFKYEENGVMKEYTPMQKAEIISGFLTKANENAAAVIDEKLGRNNITIK